MTGDGNPGVATLAYIDTLQLGADGASPSDLDAAKALSALAGPTNQSLSRHGECSF